MRDNRVGIPRGEPIGEVAALVTGALAAMLLGALDGSIAAII